MDMEMNNKMVFATTVLAGSLFLVACDDIAVPEEPVTPPPAEVNTLSLMENGIAAGDWSIKVGSNTDDYAHKVLENIDDTYEKTGSFKIAAVKDTDVESGVWKMETFNSASGDSAEVNFLIVNDATPIDLTDYQNGTMLIDLSVLVAAESDATHQVQMQTTTGTEDWKNRSAFYFSQNQLAALESQGEKKVAIPMSCITPSDTFDITKVNEPLRFVIKNDAEVTYEIRSVVLSDSSVAPEGAVAWTCG